MPRKKDYLLQMQNSAKGVTTEIVTVTPEMASKWVQDVEINRPMRNGTVKRYVKDIEGGKWLFNGASFVFDKKGRLIDGYHRSYAIIKANKPIVSVVVKGVDNSAFMSMDNGSLRSPADTLNIGGVKNSSKTASAVSKYLALRNKKWIVSSSGDTNLTVHGLIGSRNMRVYEEYCTNKELFDEVVEFASTMKKKRDKLCSSMRLTLSDIAAITYYLHKDLGHDLSLIESFFEELLEIRQVDNPKPYIEDFKTIMNNDFNSVRKLKPKTRQTYLAKVWNSYIGQSDSKSKKLRITAEEEKNGVKFL